MPSRAAGQDVLPYAYAQDFTLLATKLNIPPSRPRDRVVPRPRLIQRLDEGLRLGCKLTLISAPAGFGKTTLLSEWVASCERPVAWLSLDENDNDLVRFMTYLVAVLQTIEANIGKGMLGLLQSPQPPPIESVLIALINEVAATPKDFILVLDDYHVIEAQPIHNALAFLLDHLPGNMHLVITTRAAPPLPLSRLRGRGQMIELRAADLRFRPEEAAAFLNRVMGLGLSAEEVAALEARTEGWIVGLQMAALSMQGRHKKRVAGFIAALSGSHRYILDYLADEVLTQQPEGVRTFLLRTSILDRLIGPLCDAVTGQDNGQRMLRQLEAANLFVVPLDDERRWYRYHRLFSDFLRTGLDMESQAVLHLKAMHWLASHDLLPEAVHHALASGDMDEAAQMIALAAEGALRTASFMTLLGWLNAIPDEVVRAKFELATYKGFLLFLTRKFTEAAAYTVDAERCLPPDAPSSSRGRLLSLKAHDALCSGLLDAAAQLSEEALDYLDEGDTFFRSQTLNVLGQVLQTQGDIAAAADVYYEAVLTGRGAGDRQDVMHVLLNLVAALNELGQRDEALAMCQQTIEESAVQPGRSSPWTEIVHLVIGLLSYEANELDLAREQIMRALDVGEQLNFTEIILLGPYFLAQVHLARGEIGAMRKVIHQVRQFAARSNLDLPYEPWFAALEAQASLQQGDLAAATRWAEEAKLTPDDTPHPLMEFVYFVYVRTLLAQNRLEDARTLLSTIERSAREGGRLRKLITVYLQQALVQEALGQKDQAISLIEEAICLAAPQGYRRAFLDEGVAIVDLLLQVRAHQDGIVTPGFVDQVLNAVGVEPTMAHEQVMVAQPLVDPLSERELQVLRLLASGLSSNEVARELYIAVGTARTHIKNIYGKLGVHSRVEAVVRAQELRLM